MVRVIYVSEKIGNGKKNDRKKNGYIGMNSEAFKSIYKKKYPFPKDTILIYDKMSGGKKERTLRHEVIEKGLMEEGKMGYSKSHKIANILEDNKEITVRASNRARGYQRRI